MPKPLKIILISLVSLILLVAVLIAGIFIFIDPNDYKDEITTAVHDATGRDLTIAGDMKLSIFPWLGLTLGATQLSNAKGFGDMPFASVNAVDIKVKLLPLLHKRVEMQKILLHGLHANLAKDKTGHSNWDDLTSPKAKAAAKPIAPKTPTKPSAAEPGKAIGALGALAIDGLELKNARLAWDDQQTGQHIVIDNLNLSTGPVAFPAPVDISLSMDLQMQAPAVHSHVDFSGQVAMNPDKQQYSANKLKLTVKASGEGLPVSPLDVRLQANVSADLAQQQAKITQLQLDTLGITVNGQTSIANLDENPAVSGHVSLADFSPRNVVSQLGIKLPETADKTALSKATMETDFSASLNGANVKNLAIALDDTRLSGSARVNNFASPRIQFNLAADDIDLDRYLPPPAEKPTTPPTPGTAATAATQLPLEPLRKLNLDGTISLGKLKVIGARLSNLQLTMHAKGGQIRLHPMQASLYAGHYDGDVALDVRTNTPKTSLDEKLSTVNVGPLLKDVLGKELVSGKATATAQLTTTGADVDTIKRTLNGKANFSFRDGKVKGVNIGQLIREAYAKIKNKPAPPKTENVTDFAEMSGSVAIHNGVVRNDDLNAKSPLLRIEGKGSADLPKERVNYLVNAAIVESNEGQTGKELEDLKSLIIPIKVSGKLTNPHYSLDLKPILQARAKKAVEAEKKKIKKRAEKQLKKKKKEFMEDLKKKLKF
jgi:AsmA protein